MRIWIDQSRCQNSGLCEEEAPDLFAIGEDFYAYVRQNGTVLDDPGGEGSQADVPQDRLEVAEQVARECPAKCIHIVD